MCDMKPGGDAGWLVVSGQKAKTTSIHVGPRTAGATAVVHNKL
jgi:hypothetical protein